MLAFGSGDRRRGHLFVADRAGFQFRPLIPILPDAAHIKARQGSRFRPQGRSCISGTTRLFGTAKISNLPLISRFVKTTA